MSEVEAVVTAFNAAINARDREALAALMDERHRFVDAAGGTVEGKAACLEAWRGFFASFPDYRNVFDDVRGDGTGAVEIRGRSECSEPALHGPARWHAEVRDGLVLLWQVTEG
jgi:ketosteroid isomerase-like protein